MAGQSCGSPRSRPLRKAKRLAVMMATPQRGTSARPRSRQKGAACIRQRRWRPPLALVLLECERIRAVAEDGFKGVWRFASRGAFCLTTALRSCLTATIYLIASLRLSITCAHRNHSSRTRTLDTGIRLLMLLFMLIIIYRNL